MAYNRTNLVTGQATLSTTSAIFVQSNLERDFIRVSNTEVPAVDPADDVLIAVGPSPASMTTAIIIRPGMSEDFPCNNALAAIASEGTPVLQYAEYTTSD